jgi:hypothetical protein
MQWVIGAIQSELKVCLKGKIHVDGRFMTCMSAAFRVCLYLTAGATFSESDDEFKTDRFNLQLNIFGCWIG